MNHLLTAKVPAHTLVVPSEGPHNAGGTLKAGVAISKSMSALSPRGHRAQLV
jgi:hypothetical protein